MSYDGPDKDIIQEKMKDLIKKVADFVVKHASSKEELIPFQEEGDIREPFFAPIRDEGLELEIAYIDGGSAMVLELPNLFITFNKVAAVVYRGNRFSRIVGPYVFISCLGTEGRRAVTRIFGAEGFMPERMEHYSGYWEVLRSVPRRVAERRLALLMLEAVDAVVLDGTLGFQHEENEVEIMRKLFARAKSGILAGLAKSTKLLYKGMPVTAFATTKFGRRNHFAAYIGGLKRLGYETKLYVVKLSSAAKKAFLLEVAYGDVDDLLYNLAIVSADPGIPGYPYPLVEADRMTKIHLRDEITIVKNALIEAIASRNGGIELLEEGLIHDLLNELNP